MVKSVVHKGLYILTIVIALLSSALGAETNVLKVVVEKAPIDLLAPVAEPSRTREAFEKAFKRLKTQDSLRGLVVNENIGQRELVAEEIRRVAGDTPWLLLSIPWENPPASFPADRTKRAARDRRGIAVTGIFGEITARFEHAPFLIPNELLEAEWTKTEEPHPDYTNTAKAFLSSLELVGSNFENVLQAIPGLSASSIKLGGIMRAGKKQITLASLYSEMGPPNYWITTRSGVSSNTPAVLLLHGRFSTNKWRNFTYNEEFAPLANMFPYAENPLMHTANRLGAVGIAVARFTEQGESVRLWQSGEGENQTGQDFDGHKIREQGMALTLADLDFWSDLLLSEGKPFRYMKLCGGFNPGVGFRLKGKAGEILVSVCLECGTIEFNVKDTKGQTVSRGYYDFQENEDAPQERIRRMALRAFPNWAELKKKD